MRFRSLSKSASLVMAGVIIGAFLLGPAGAHVGGTVPHLWRKHIRPLATKAFYAKKKADSRFVRKASVRTGYVSCPAAAFQENEPSDYDMSQGLRYFAGPGTQFACNAALPHGATVKAVHWTIHDTSMHDGMSCSMSRVNLMTGATGTMAVELQHPPTMIGTGRLSDTSIQLPVVDNDEFAYQVACSVDGSGSDIGFYGASVEYEVTGTEGAAS